MTAPARIFGKLNDGEVCILPTETVYGLAGRADIESAVDEIYALKDRNYEIPLALCVKDLTMARKFGVISQLARDLGLSPGTVARSYRELEGAGVIETRGRHGSFVAKVPVEPDRRATSVVDGAASQLRRLGLTLEEASALLADRWSAT